MNKFPPLPPPIENIEPDECRDWAICPLYKFI